MLRDLSQRSPGVGLAVLQLGSIIDASAVGVLEMGVLPTQPLSSEAVPAAAPAALALAGRRPGSLRGLSKY